MNHYPAQTLSLSRNGRAMWAKTTPTNAIVFVHGFNGDTVSTFKDFPSLLAGEARAATYDVFLFGYDSLKINAGAAAADLMAFLDKIGDNAKSVMDVNVPPKWRRTQPFTYKRILIVAHSLGAIVTRLTLLRGDRRSPRPSWLSNVEFALYAPAHLGATIEELVRESFVGPFATFLKGKISVLHTLRKGSPLIRELQRDSLEVLEKAGPTNHVRARRVVHSRIDRVVETDARFCADPDPDYVEEHRTHISVCKATIPNARPFAYLVELL